eukprot:1358903-Amorphochlora_amoeboformis.AAC.1
MGGTRGSIDTWLALSVCMRGMFVCIYTWVPGSVCVCGMVVCIACVVWWYASRVWYGGMHSVWGMVVCIACVVWWYASIELPASVCVWYVGHCMHQGNSVGEWATTPIIKALDITYTNYGTIYNI